MTPAVNVIIHSAELIYFLVEISIIGQRVTACDLSE